ncbi:SMP-30/gluconolactonase/LRE family protein [Vibrio quintilis]|uniref:Gluconolactonase n=1 Tax=Vibrio quintilis TaxID=1117707 RepID=A0A1M7YRU0_9VIBR|nr:SMP-30/gluconolactonase/LRE family protein [Vibrio quintilis]SHO55323.1 Gluconolactonase precursor [Vibrio quintilis]
MSFKQAIISELTRVSEGHIWCEGAAWLQHSRQLLFSDVKKNAMYTYDPQTRQTELVVEPSNFANGNYVLSNGNVVTCEHGRRCISLRHRDNLASARILVEKFDGKRLNSPNDVVERQSDGTIWFTDPPYGITSDEEGYKSESQIIGCYVYCYDPADDSLVIATTDVQRPNGLVFSPDEKTLYVADMSVVDFPSCGLKHLKMFDVEDKRLLNGRLVYQVAQGIPDGMTVDRYGTLYCSSAEGILVLDRHMNLMGKIPVPETVSNCTFNDDETVLYITASTSVYCIELDCQTLAKI